VHVALVAAQRLVDLQVSGRQSQIVGKVEHCRQRQKAGTA
jgi:hypothetical protein